MARDFTRSDRLGELIQRELARLIQYELKDPRVTTMVTVSAVKVSRDLSNAKVYVSFFDVEHKKEILDVLKKAAGFFRSSLAQRIQIRMMPELRFVYDDSIREGRHLSSLIDQALEDDRATKDKLSKDK